MFRTNAVGNTVWVKDLTTEKVQGKDGLYDAKSILFRFATNRNYKRTVIKDGKQVEERPTDFVLCRANGKLAEAIANNCKAVDAEGKFVSRRLYLDGHFEMYVSKRTFKIENLPVSIPNVGTVNLTFDTPQEVDGLIFVVDEMEFLDWKPATTEQPQVTVASNVVVTPQQVQVPVNVAPQQTYQQPVVQQPASVQPTYQQPVVQQPTQPMNVQATVGTPNNFAGAMNVPTVPEGFTGDGAPF